VPDGSPAWFVDGVVPYRVFRYDMPTFGEPDSFAWRTVRFGFRTLLCQRLKNSTHLVPGTSLPPGTVRLYGLHRFATGILQDPHHYLLQCTTTAATTGGPAWHLWLRLHVICGRTGSWTFPCGMFTPRCPRPSPRTFGRVGSQVTNPQDHRTPTPFIGRLFLTVCDHYLP